MSLRKLFSAYYSWYDNKEKDPYFSSILAFVATQQFWVAAIAVLARKYIWHNIPIYKGNIYFVIPVSIVWAWLFFRAFPRKKVAKWVTQFKEERKSTRAKWIVLSVIIAVLPVVMLLLFA